MADSALTQDVRKAMWNHALAALLFAVVGVVGVLFETAKSLADIWWRSETYAHGMLIVPIAIWLAWKKREYLARLEPRPAFGVIFLLLGAAIGWCLARLVGVLVVEQFALVAILVLTVWVVLGHRVARRLTFPLLFLFLAVPIGVDLVPPMMEFTATFTVWMLQLTGIPVYRDGLQFAIPSGTWSVIEACSGIRYLIASLTLGVLYAYLSYQSLSRRVIFIAFSIVVPIFANGLRAYMIVMIGHLSDMKLAKGVDHLLYGWVFFGIVMLIMFWVGSYWSERTTVLGVQEPSVPTRAGRVEASKPTRSYLVAGLSVAVVFGCYLFVNEVANRPVALVGTLSAPSGEGGWVAVNDFETSWRAQVLDSGNRLTQTYRRGSDWVIVDAALFAAQQQDSEAVSSQNAVAGPAKTAKWRIRSRWTVERSRNSATATVNAFNLTWQGGLADRGDVDDLLVWQWYRMGEYDTAQPYVAKLLTAVNLVYPGRRDGTFFTVATSADEDKEAASALLERFVVDMADALNQRIDTAVLGSARP